MIESRYKIEYVLPDEDVKKISPFRVLWYLLLIPLVVSAVIGITYDFSLKNISHDSLILVEKAKIHIFNLGDIQEITTKKTERVNEEIINEVKTTIKPVTLVADSSSSVPELKNNQDKLKAPKLTSQQELQLKTIQTQIAKNSELSINLNKISEKLLLEQLRTQKLNSQLAEQEKDRQDLEDQLNQVLESSVNNEIILDELTTQDIQDAGLITAPKITKSETQTKSNPSKLAKETVAEETPSKITQETVQNIPQKTANEDVVIQSETDKIIETMANITSVKEKDLDTETVITEKPIENIVQSPKPTPTLKKTEIAKTIDKVDVDVEKTTKVETPDNKDSEKPEEVVESDNKDPSDSSNEGSNEGPSENSAVDDIVAAMQESQSAGDKASGIDKEIDLDLEKDIKNQLVEKGDLSIDN